MFETRLKAIILSDRKTNDIIIINTESKELVDIISVKEIEIADSKEKVEEILRREEVMM